MGRSAPTPRLWPVLGLLWLVPIPACAQDVESADVGLAREAFQTGDYDEAVRQYGALAREGRDYPTAARGWAESLAITGEYEAALDALDEARTGAANPVELDRVRGAVLRVVGRLDEAETALRRSIDGAASDAELARLELGELLWRRGDRDRAIAIFDGFIDFYNASVDPTAAELTAVGTALTYLGRRDSGLFHDAVRAYGEAIAADPGDPMPRILMAELFLSKFDSREAGTLLDEADARNPDHPRAALTRARRAKFDGSYAAIELTERSLEINPNDPVARAFLARLYVDLNDTGRAAGEARRALETNPVSLEALTELAAIAHLEDDAEAFRAHRDRILALNPAYSELFEALAEAAYRTHRYRDAVEFAEEAVALDNTAWSAYAALGLNQLRVGELETGRQTLESAFAGDPFNLWVKNTLDLLDELSAFEETRSDRFVFLIHPDESELLSIYAPELAEEAFDAMSARYGYEPPTPISVEVYDRHADFSVRTVGLAGIGALGVSFGSVLAMDSPGARPEGEFNWGSTLWHEISHAFTLGYTDHRVPRWLSEGLAVLDERHARDGWGGDVSPGFLQAFRDERLPSLARFNYGFVRPEYPGQVQHSYYMASLLVQMIEEEDGFAAILAMLDGYRDGLETPAVFERVFGLDADALDERLSAYIETRFAPAIAALDESQPGGGEFLALLTSALAHRSEGRTDEAIAALERAREVFPEYAGADAPTLLLARMHRERGDDDAALEAYRAYTALNENHLEAHVALAELEEAAGNAAGMRDALERALWIDPYRQDVHEKLAAAEEEAGDWSAGVRERRALLGLDPNDRAAAYYRLALALYRDGDTAAARSTVLRALEIAPNYEDAIDLLIQIRGGGR
ncbi:MAG: tetratricopeptide repeat protein [Gemmatimonadota bacterium]|nr:tetratricopeptide repeat protein [Gemmatimonadota bacterium]